MKDAEIIINDVVKGEYDLPRQFAPVVHEIPDATSKDAGKSLTVDKDGCPTWGEGGGSIQHDWYQNDATAKDYIKNRPGGYTITTPGYEITWDGVVGDKVVVDGGEMQLVKVSDRVFTVEELIGATAIFGDRSFIVSNDTIGSQNGIIMGECFFLCSPPRQQYTMSRFQKPERISRKWEKNSLRLSLNQNQQPLSKSQQN